MGPARTRSLVTPAVLIALFGIGILSTVGGWPAGARSPVSAASGRSTDGVRRPTGTAAAPFGRLPAIPASTAAADPLDLGRLAPPTPSSVSVPTCRFGDDPAIHAGMDDWASTIVDTDLELPSSYVPPDLVPVTRAGIGGWGLVRSLVVDDLAALADAARAAGNPIAVQSAYRSRTRQADVFADWVAQHGEAEARRFSARPGHSEHQLGTALDIRAAAGGAPWTGSFGQTAAGRWVAQHAVEFGFVLSYPPGAEARTCYGGEAWHLRYVGRDRAAVVEASGLTLREWLFAHAGG